MTTAAAASGCNRVRSSLPFIGRRCAKSGGPSEAQANGKTGLVLAAIDSNARLKPPPAPAWFESIAGSETCRTSV